MAEIRDKRDEMDEEVRKYAQGSHVYTDLVKIRNLYENLEKVKGVKGKEKQRNAFARKITEFSIGLPPLESGRKNSIPVLYEQVLRAINNFIGPVNPATSTTVLGKRRAPPPPPARKDKRHADVSFDIGKIRELVGREVRVNTGVEKYRGIVKEVTMSGALVQNATTSLVKLVHPSNLTVTGRKYTEKERELNRLDYFKDGLNTAAPEYGEDEGEYMDLDIDLEDMVNKEARDIKRRKEENEEGYRPNNDDEDAGPDFGLDRIAAMSSEYRIGSKTENDFITSSSSSTIIERVVKEIYTMIKLNRGKIPLPISPSVVNAIKPAFSKVKAALRLDYNRTPNLFRAVIGAFVHLYLENRFKVVIPVAKYISDKGYIGPFTKVVDGQKVVSSGKVLVEKFTEMLRTKYNVDFPFSLRGKGQRVPRIEYKPLRGRSVERKPRYVQVRKGGRTAADDPTARVRTQGGIIARPRALQTRNEKVVFKKKDGRDMFGGYERPRFGPVPDPNDPLRKFNYNDTLFGGTRGERTLYSEGHLGDEEKDHEKWLEGEWDDRTNARLRAISGYDTVALGTTGQYNLIEMNLAADARELAQLEAREDELLAKFEAKQDSPMYEQVQEASIHFAESRGKGGLTDKAFRIEEDLADLETQITELRLNPDPNRARNRVRTSTLYKNKDALKKGRAFELKKTVMSDDVLSKLNDLKLDLTNARKTRPTDVPYLEAKIAGIKRRKTTGEDMDAQQLDYLNTQLVRTYGNPELILNRLAQLRRARDRRAVSDSFYKNL